MFRQLQLQLQTALFLLHLCIDNRIALEQRVGQVLVGQLRGGAAGTVVPSRLLCSWFRLCAEQFAQASPLWRQLRNIQPQVLFQAGAVDDTGDIPQRQPWQPEHHGQQSRADASHQQQQHQQ